MSLMRLHPMAVQRPHSALGNHLTLVEFEQ